MTDGRGGLQGLRILVLEDDYYLAMELQEALERAGATVIGPFPDAANALAALDRVGADCAFVDVNLGQGPSFDLPRALAGRSVPFAFVTGYDAGTIPAEFAGAPRFEKPMDLRNVVETAALLVERR